MELIGEIPPIHVWEQLGLPAGLGDYFDWLEKHGAKRLLWTPDPAALKAVDAALIGRTFKLAAVLPNMSVYARDAMDAGPTGAVLKRFKALPPLRLAELGLRLLPRTPALLERRFSAGIMLLVEAERLRLAAPPQSVILHGSIVDMALAFGCREMLETFESWARKRGVQGVFMTNNLGLWAQRTKEWGMAGLTALTPVNAKGYLMQPDRASVEAFCGAHPVWAMDADAGSGDWDAARSFLEKVSVARAVIPWGAYRRTTPAERLTAWKKRTG